MTAVYSYGSRGPGARAAFSWQFLAAGYMRGPPKLAFVSTILAGVAGFGSLAVTHCEAVFSSEVTDSQVHSK